MIVPDGLIWYFPVPHFWPKEDCEYLEQVILQQQSEMKDYPFQKLKKKSTFIDKGQSFQ